MEPRELRPVVAQVAPEDAGVIRPEELFQKGQLPQGRSVVAFGDQEAELEPELGVGYGEDRLPVRGLPPGRAALPLLASGWDSANLL